MQAQKGRRNAGRESWFNKVKKRKGEKVERYKNTKTNIKTERMVQRGKEREEKTT